jgi:hypothetical protein
VKSSEWSNGGHVEEGIVWRKYRSFFFFFKLRFIVLASKLSDCKYIRSPTTMYVCGSQTERVIDVRFVTGVNMDRLSLAGNSYYGGIK